MFGSIGVVGACIQCLLFCQFVSNVRVCIENTTRQHSLSLSKRYASRTQRHEHAAKYSHQTSNEHLLHLPSSSIRIENAYQHTSVLQTIAVIRFIYLLTFALCSFAVTTYRQTLAKWWQRDRIERNPAKRFWCCMRGSVWCSQQWWRWWSRVNDDGNSKAHKKNRLS